MNGGDVEVESSVVAGAASIDVECAVPFSLITAHVTFAARSQKNCYNRYWKFWT